MASAKDSITLPADYLRTRRRLRNREIELDWRKLRRREPEMWPGMLCLYSALEARRETARLRLLAPQWRDQVFCIGTNTAGLLLAIDHKGRVVVLDECELDGPVVLARDFAAFEATFVDPSNSAAYQSARAKADRVSATSGRSRKEAAAWKRLDEILGGTHPLSRTANRVGVLVDIVWLYRLAGRLDALHEELRAFRKRHGSRGATLVRKLSPSDLPVR